MREPRILQRKPRDLNLEEYKLRSALETDYAELITEPTIVTDGEGIVRIVYLELDDDCEELVSALKTIKYAEDYRTGGLPTRSRIFGYSPRITIRRDYCTTTALGWEQPDVNALVASYAKRVSTYYQRYNPELYAHHQREVEKVLPDWKLEDSVFTSGIINKNNPLLYHHDAGNFRNVWSNMLVFKDRIAGGYLACPEYDIGFQLKNNSLLMFDGQNILHGVTPIKLLAEDSTRFSIVFYALRGMWQCLPPGEEMVRFRKVRTEREERRLRNPVLPVKKKKRRPPNAPPEMTVKPRAPLAEPLHNLD